MKGLPRLPTGRDDGRPGRSTAVWAARARRLALLLPVLLALAHLGGWLSMPVLHRIDDFVYDLRLRIARADSLDPRIVIVDIDEKSLSEQGRWPWGRDRLARLVDELFSQQQVALVGFDVVFAEPDTSSGLARLQQLAAGELADQPAFLRRLQTLAPELDFDSRFARAIANRPVVLGYYFNLDPQGQSSGQLPPPVMGADTLQGRRQRFTAWRGYGASLPLLAQAAPQAGFFNPLIDDDGKVRAVPLLAEYQGQVYESLTLSMFRELQGRPAVEPVFAQGLTVSGGKAPLQALRLRPASGVPLELPVGDGAVALVPYRGLPGPQGGSFRYLSATDLIEGRLARGHLQGRIVLVGSSAPGLQDLRPTPVSEAFPGVEIHAHLLSAMLDGQLPVRPDYSVGYEAALVLLMGGGLALALPLLPALPGLLAVTGALVLPVLSNLALYQWVGLALPLAATLATMLAVLLLHLGGLWVFETRARRALVGLFGSYVPPELVEEMVRDPDRYSMRADSRELTVMFCDMHGFTRLAERLPPEQLQALLQGVFDRLGLVVREHRGTIDKFMGDCLMAFWGAPLPAADHAALAVRAALGIAEEVGRINADHQARGLPAVGFGVGLSTGRMCVGDMGSRLRRAYTVIGDAVNLGARLQSLTTVYGVDIVASDATRQQAGGTDWQALDTVRLSGRQDAVTLWCPLPPGAAAASSALAQELRGWEAFLVAWRRQDWATAAPLLQTLTRQGSCPRLYALYERRLALRRHQPPDPAWDGIADLGVG